MPIRATTITVPTTGRYELADATDAVEQVVASSGLKSGQATVFSQDLHAKLLVNERESGLLEDLKRLLEQLGSTRDRGHQSLIGSPSVVLPVVGGKLCLGLWQRVLLVEMSDAAERSLIVQIVGE